MYYEILTAGLYLLVISAKVLLNLSAWAKREGLIIQNTSPVSAHTMFVIVLRTATSMRFDRIQADGTPYRSYMLTALPKVLPLLYLYSDLGTLRKEYKYPD